MAKQKTNRKRRNSLDLENLSPRDIDILSLDTKDVMQKYHIGKQPVYDRRFALNKRINAAGLTIEQILNTTGENTKEKTTGSSATVKKAAAEKSEIRQVASRNDEREAEARLNQKPVIIKPIEVSFDNFSIRINGTPRRISVNPDTHIIEIDL